MGDRGWRIVEGVAVLLLVATLLGLGDQWRATGMNTDAIEDLEAVQMKSSARLDKIESAGTLVLLAQGAERLEKLEAAAETSVENAKAIEGIRATQSAQGGQLRRIEDAQNRQTDLIIRALDRDRHSTAIPESRDPDRAAAPGHDDDDDEAAVTSEDPPTEDDGPWISLRAPRVTTDPQP